MPDSAGGRGPDDPDRRRDTNETTMSLQGLGAEPAEAPDVELGLSRDDQAAVEALPPGSALLIVQRGPNAGSRFLLDSDRTTTGRHPDSEIFLDDVTVSRKHAEFVREGGAFHVRDVGSLNGTYVNRVRIDGAELRAGDEVQIGKFRLMFYPSHQRGGGSGQ